MNNISLFNTLWPRLIEIGAKSNESVLMRPLLEAYNGTDRHYHALSHILSMIQEFEEIRDMFIDPIAAEMAIWHHDYVYNTHSHNNEKASASYARMVCDELKLPESFADKVEELILATSHREDPRTHDAKLIVDLDLAVLGKPEKEFDEYDANIRKEYYWVSNGEYQNGRIKYLEAFLGRNYIYWTEYFRNKYETKARTNLQRVIARLRS